MNHDYIGLENEKQNNFSVYLYLPLFITLPTIKG